MKKTSLHSKIRIAITVPFILLAIIIYTFVYNIEYENLTEERKELIKSEVLSCVDYYNALTLKIPKAQADYALFTFVNNVIYSEKLGGYFYLYDMNGKLLAHRYLKEKINTSLYDFQDTKGNYVIREHIELVKKNPKGDFLTFWFIKNDSDTQSYPKIAFTKKIGSDMLIGTGVYFDDLKHRATLVAVTIAGMLIAGLIITMVILKFLMKRILSPLKDMEDILQKMAEGNLNQQLTFTSNDELGKMSESLSEFIIKLNSSIGEIKTNEEELNNLVSFIQEDVSSYT
ncbi:MAG: cache domain-containing protein, partial [Spirochaetales bacterium]|nr:cache domain-containing protein [Spirochaetales bacterium]